MACVLQASDGASSRIGFAGVEVTQHLLALEPRHFEGAFDEVPVAILVEQGEGRLGLLEVRDRLQPRPAERGVVGLVERGADEEAVVAHRLCEVRQAPRARAVEVADGREVLAARHERAMREVCT